MSLHFDIKTGETIGNFRVNEVTPLYEQNETAVMLSHGPTGLQWLHFIADDPVSSCAIGITTPVSDDRGIPHVLEHMVLKGSRRRPGTDLLRAMQNQTAAKSMGSYTFPSCTVYHFDSAVESDMRAIFEVWFDAILRPELSEATFRREAGHFQTQDISHPDGPIVYTGTVFNEMCENKGNKGKLTDKIIKEARRHLVPDNGLGFDILGRPAAIMSLTSDDVRVYHKRWYCPANMRIVTRGREMPRTLLEIADKLLDGVEAGEAAPPFSPQPRWNAPHTAEIALSASESLPRRRRKRIPNQGIIWLLPDASDYRASEAIDNFVWAIDLVEIMNKAAVAKDDAFARGQGWCRPCPTPMNFTGMFRRIGPDKFFGLYGHFDPIYPGETLWTRTERELRKLFDDSETARRIASEASRSAIRVVNVLNDGEGLSKLAHKEAFQWVFHNWLFKDDPFCGFVSSRPLAISYQFERNPDSVLKIVRDLLLNNPHRLDFSIREVQAEPLP